MVQDADLRSHNEADPESARSLIQHLFHDLTSLASLELALIRLEVAQKAAAAAKGFGQLAAAGVLGLVALLALALAIVAVLAGYMPLWGAALIVSAIFGIVTMLLLNGARSALARTTSFSSAHTARRVLRPANAGASIPEVEARIEFTRARIEEELSSLEHKTDLLPPLRDTAVSIGSLGATVNAIIRQTRDQQRSE